MLDEAQARQIIGQAGAAVLVDVIEGAWQDHVDEGKPRHSTTRANVVWDYMVKRADADLAPMEGVTRVERYRRPVYVLRDRMLLRFKMHSHDFTTVNVSTRRQRDAEQTGLFDDLAFPHITCGYVLDRAEAGITAVVAVRRVQGVVEWVVDLRELASGEMQPATPIIPDFPSLPGVDRAPLPGIAFKRKEAKDEEP